MRTPSDRPVRNGSHGSGSPLLVAAFAADRRRRHRRRGPCRYAGARRVSAAMAKLGRRRVRGAPQSGWRRRSPRARPRRRVLGERRCRRRPRTPWRRRTRRTRARVRVWIAPTRRRRSGARRRPRRRQGSTARARACVTWLPRGGDAPEVSPCSSGRPERARRDASNPPAAAPRAREQPEADDYRVDARRRLHQLACDQPDQSRERPRVQRRRAGRGVHQPPLAGDAARGATSLTPDPARVDRGPRRHCAQPRRHHLGAHGIDPIAAGHHRPRPADPRRRARVRVLRSGVEIHHRAVSRTG